MNTWRKSTYSSGSDPSSCVEVRGLDEAIAVRDSTDPEGPRLDLAPHTWRTLLETIKTQR
ncbi:DUF397 domain-containing protein [Actinomadura macrotermitis]|uniref:DUF397 domain-containing protein n=1 Tax=Actinomadura macrotermitis TaxID=2585200 RepID=A0A7K0C1T8_9ACTN|nr:DUF397 domain-containing protein [Actinomadura macrotermitis]MQY07435.1 hypothetical protein [Actinomadura macrotermitis]